MAAMAACYAIDSPPTAPSSVKQPTGTDGSSITTPVPTAQAPARDTSTLVVSVPPTQTLATTLPVPPLAAPTPAYQVTENHDVQRFLDQYQTGYRRAIVEKWLVRAGRYLPMVLDVFRQKGLPEELVFTAMIESGFDPLAVSRMGAKGLWQFMAPTARRYGLRIDEWLDERLDPEKSTMAAARHFVDLYSVFGSWNLAQAAYNAGERTVTDAIRAMGTSDFWALSRGRWLKDETKNYVPAIQAATIIAREPERYGFVVTPAAPLAYDQVVVPRSTSLKRLALGSGIDPAMLERLNPELRLRQTPPEGSYPLKVPLGGGSQIKAFLDRDVVEQRSLAVAARDGDRRAAHRAGAHVTRATSSAVHVVRAKETLSGIAKRYGVSVADILSWNSLDSAARIRPGTRLRIASLGHLEEASSITR
jgi:membrane-bound lytic murein transglycosylase D